jgi:hypothetical protein
MSDFVLSVACDSYEISIANRQHDLGIGRANRDNEFAHIHALGEAGCIPTSWHSVTIRTGEETSIDILLKADGGASGVHAHSALVARNRLFVAVGAYVACLQIPDLELLWATQTDEATCFGVYWSAERRCLISHGELEIARFDEDGNVLWRAFGADIFTGDFRLEAAWIEVTDFDDRSYRFDIDTGRQLDVSS